MNEPLGFSAYYRRVFALVRESAGKNLLATVTAAAASVIAAYLQDRYGVATWKSATGKVVTTIAAGAVVLGLYILAYVIRSPWKLCEKDAAENRRLHEAELEQISRLKSELQDPNLSVTVLNWSLYQHYDHLGRVEGILVGHLLLLLRVINLHRVPTVIREIEVAFRVKDGTEYPSHEIKIDDEFYNPHIDMATPISFGVPREGWIRVEIEKDLDTLNGGTAIVRLTDGTGRVSKCEERNIHYVG